MNQKKHFFGSSVLVIGLMLGLVAPLTISEAARADSSKNVPAPKPSVTPPSADKNGWSSGQVAAVGTAVLLGTVGGVYGAGYALGAYLISGAAAATVVAVPAAAAAAPVLGFGLIPTRLLKQLAHPGIDPDGPSAFLGTSAKTLPQDAAPPIGAPSEDVATPAAQAG